MELVLSPGYIEENDGSPFHSEDVHEWSHVDRLTGMLENARIERGRWHIKNQGTAHSYGKLIDSRERNSANGNIIQRGQRKVEVFQSQEIGGKSVQVVRASQWSSSRVTDFIHTSPPAKSTMEHHVGELDNDINSLSPFCQKIHSDVINDSHSLLIGQSSALLTDKKLSNTFNIFDRDKYTIDLFNEKRSNSNDDLTCQIEEEDSHPSLNFTRDYKVRRSLQLSSKKNGKDSSYSRVKVADLNNCDQNLHISKFSALKNPQTQLGTKAHLHEDNCVKASYSTSETLSRNACIGRNSISRSCSPTAMISSKANILSSHKPLTYFFQDPTENSREPLVECQKSTSIRLGVQESRPVTSNKTIVHVGKPGDKSLNHMKVSIDFKNIPENETSKDLNTQEGNVLFLTDCSVKPTKKVGFCKTEIHFVADSGKVNIVETDGKPPSTNRFRKRRRNNSNGNNNSNNSSNTSVGISMNKNLPLVHFGDTSYEKYIFGASKKQVSDKPSNLTKPREEKEYKTTWQSPLTSILALQNVHDLKKDSCEKNNLKNTQDKIEDQRHKGHTTTINFGADGFCNLGSVTQDDTAKLNNVEEISLEAPKIITALDLVTRKDDYKSRPLDGEIGASADNQSSVKFSAIHKPMIARVDFNYFSKSTKCIKSPSTLSSLYPSAKLDEKKIEKASFCMLKLNEGEEISPCLIKSNEKGEVASRLILPKEMVVNGSESTVSVTQEAKDFCDVSSAPKEEICNSNSFTPICTNMFDYGRKDMSIYMNFQAVKNNYDSDVNSCKKIKNENGLNKENKEISSLTKETNDESPKIEQELSKQLKTSTKQKSNQLIKTGSEGRKKESETESNKNSTVRRSKKETAISKEKKIMGLNKMIRVSNKSLEVDSCDRTKKIKEENSEDDKLQDSKISAVKRDFKRTGSKARSSKYLMDSESEINAREVKTSFTREKKPVEVVYKTAVYRMKNEKLSKSMKTKESKSSRCINDIICGSKEKKASTNKHSQMNSTIQKKNFKEN